MIEAERIAVAIDRYLNAELRENPDYGRKSGEPDFYPEPINGVSFWKDPRELRLVKFVAWLSS